MQAVFQQLVQFSMHSYKGVRDLAVLTLESCMKQYPAYAMQLLPIPLAAMAKLPLPQLNLQEENSALSAEVLRKLRSAMRDAAGSGTGTPPGTPKSRDPSAAGRQPENCVEPFALSCTTSQICTRLSAELFAMFEPTPVCNVNEAQSARS